MIKFNKILDKPTFIHYTIIAVGHSAVPLCLGTLHKHPVWRTSTNPQAPTYCGLI